MMDKSVSYNLDEGTVLALKKVVGLLKPEILIEEYGLTMEEVSSVQDFYKFVEEE